MSDVSRLTELSMPTELAKEVVAQIAAGGGGGGGAVNSVNGQTGTVVLDAADVGALSGITAGNGVSVDTMDPSAPGIAITGLPMGASVVATTGAQTIADVKTFSSIPVLPASDPTTDNQAVRKAYVDSTILAARKGSAANAASANTTINLANHNGNPWQFTSATEVTAMLAADLPVGSEIPLWNLGAGPLLITVASATITPASPQLAQGQAGLARKTAAGAWVFVPGATGGSSAVSSVNGQTGSVVLTAEDVNAVAGLGAGTGISINASDPQNPIITATGGGASTAIIPIAAINTPQPTILESGGTGEQDIDGWDITIPANTVGANAVLKIEVEWQGINNANNKVIRAKLDGTTVLSATATTAVLARAQKLIRSNGTQTEQFASATTVNDLSAATSSTIQTLSLDFTADVALTFTAAIAASGGDVTPRRVAVWVEDFA